MADAERAALPLFGGVAGGDGRFRGERELRRPGGGWEGEAVTWRPWDGKALGRLQLKILAQPGLQGRRRDYRVTTKRAACPRASRSNPSLICSRGRVSVNRRSTGNRPCLYSAM